MAKLMEIKIVDPIKERLKHDGIKSNNKTVRRIKYKGSTYEIDLLTDSGWYDIFNMNDNELASSGLASIDDCIEEIKSFE